MNCARRKAIEQIVIKLQVLRSDIEFLFDEETESRDNIPENLQGSERYAISDAACDNLDSALSSFDEVLDYLNEVL